MGRVGLMPLGGLRAFAAAGATIIVGKGDGAFYRKVMSAPETLNPYGTKPVPRVVAVEAVRMRPPSETSRQRGAGCARCPTKKITIGRGPAPCVPTA
jgi:hypothetical protein